MILVENDEQRNCKHEAWEKVDATGETYWRCMDCRATSEKPEIFREQ